MLRGPAHPENFRVKHGRYGDRWYLDNLPACDIAAPMDEPVPSVSAVKNAWPKFLTNWAAGEAAAFAYDHKESWQNLDRAAAVQLISKAHERSRDASAGRGNAIHECIESLSVHGKLSITEELPAEYEGVIKQLVDDLQPEFIVSEAVAIKQGDQGYGGTMDAIAKLAGFGVRGIDWKSRKQGKGGSAYADEFAQVAGYLSADYFIVAGENADAVRASVPRVDGIAVITIEPDSYCVCGPDENGKAIETWKQLRRFWAVQTLNPPRSKRLTPFASGDTTNTAEPGSLPEAVGSVEEPTTITVPAPVTSTEGKGTAATAPSVDHHAARVAWAFARIDAIRDAGHIKTLGTNWDDEIPKPAAVRDGKAQWDEAQLEWVLAKIDATEARWEMTFGTPDPAVADAETLVVEKLHAKHVDPPRLAEPDEGDDWASSEQVEGLRTLLRTMIADGDANAGVVIEWQKDGERQRRPWSMKKDGERTSMRRYLICLAALELVAHIDDTADDPQWAVRHLIAVVIGDDAHMPIFRVGGLLGTLTTDQAKRLACLAETHRVATGDDGSPQLTAVA